MVENIKDLIVNAPDFVKNNLIYLTVSGSRSYGIATERSDTDYIGICVPPKEIVFPHLTGAIPGFTKNIQGFDQFITKSENENGPYDLTVYSAVKFFRLALDCNPNIIEVLYTDHKCIKYETDLSNFIRLNRHSFLHKQLAARFIGYSKSQIEKLRGKNPQDGSKRKDLKDVYGFDVKFAANYLRILWNCEQLLEEETLDLKRHSTMLKEIRAGKISLNDIVETGEGIKQRLKVLETQTSLPPEPREYLVELRLKKCLELFYEEYKSKCI